MTIKITRFLYSFARGKFRGCEQGVAKMSRHQQQLIESRFIRSEGLGNNGSFSPGSGGIVWIEPSCLACRQFGNKLNEEISIKKRMICLCR
jgi:hypothetical protein